MDEKMLTGRVAMANNVEIYYQFYQPENAKALVVIMPGRAESCFKYAELCYEMQKNGFAILLFDHQGQGLSTRRCLNPQIGFVDQFEDYIQDAIQLIGTVQTEQSITNLPIYLLAHSMGGAIGSCVMIEKPALFEKAVLMAPMYGISAPIPVWLAKKLVSIGLKRQLNKQLDADYFWGQQNYIPVEFSKNHLTHSQQRYQYFVETHSQNAKLQLGGVSFQWLQQAFRMMEYIKVNLDRIQTPSKIFLATQDTVVNSDEIKKLANRVKNAQLIEVQGAKHEILFETDDLRHFALRQIFDFFEL